MQEKILAMLQEINPYVDIDETTQLLVEILDSMELLLLITQLEETYSGGRF